MDRLRFGTAGIPISTPLRTTENGVKHVKELGLGCMELEFVHSINISPEKAPAVKEAAKEADVTLTCHAPYFINLNSDDKAKYYASIQRIEKSAEILGMCGGIGVCFHAGFYQKQTREATYDNIKRGIEEIRKRLDEKGIDVLLRPETTGKETQFGNYDELLRISSEVEGVMPVFDFSHIHARSVGKYNTLEEFRNVLRAIEGHLGREGLENMHIHVSGIAYGDKGEKNHLILDESDLNYRDLVEAWKEFRIKGVVISESPNIEGDALLLRNTYLGERR